MTIIISAMSKDHYIGNKEGNGMPWDVPEEYQQFLNFIKDQSVIMGRKSFEIFKSDMPSSHNFVITRSSQKIPGATISPSLSDAIEKAKKTKKEIFIAGGGSIYEQAIPIAEKMYLSYIHGNFEGRVKFPQFDLSEWDITKNKLTKKFDFVIYERKNMEIK